jgi:hypothetical protein
MRFGLGSNIGHSLFLGWVEHPDTFVGFRSSAQPTYQPFFVLSAKPNKMAEDRTIRCDSNDQNDLSKE